MKSRLFVCRRAEWVDALAYGAGARLRKRFVAIVLSALMVSGQALAEEARLLAFGDSLTQGYGLPEQDGFVPQLERWLRAQGADVSVINAGVSGDTTAGGASRIGWALSEKVDAVLVELGANDLLRGIEPAVARANLTAVLQEISEQGLPVVLAGMPAPANYGPDYKTAFDAIYPELANQFDAVLYPNFLGALAQDAALSSASKFMQADGLHPSREGVALIVEDIGPVLLKVLSPEG